MIRRFKLTEVPMRRFLTVFFTLFISLSPSLHASFDQFRKDTGNGTRFDNISHRRGLKYITDIRTKYPDLLSMMEIFRKNDSLGNPEVYDYHDIGTFSPTTLRYISIAADLRAKYGDKLRSMRIVEFGKGYGGLCSILAKMTGFSSYTLIDQEENNQISRWYLQNLNVANTTCLDIADVNHMEQYDLFICTSPLEGFNTSLEKLFQLTPYGYIAYEASDLPNKSDYLSFEHLVSKLLTYEKKGCVGLYGLFQSPLYQTLTWKPLDEYVHTPFATEIKEHSAVTYDFSGGRFGDNLMAYFHAKWVARKYGYPFRYKGFPYSFLLQLDDMDTPFSNGREYLHQRRISDLQQIFEAPDSTLLTIPYFTDSKFEYDMLRHQQEGQPYFIVNWEDPDFHREIVACLTPKFEIETMELPEDHLTVAIHVRRGGAYEPYSEVAKGYPLKAPPDSYFISAIQWIAEIYPDRLIYVHLFTDDVNPKVIAEKYAQAIQNDNITIEWCPGVAPSDDLPLFVNDFYSLAKFDCLIRSSSNFSVMAAHLGNYSLEFIPEHAYFSKGEVMIDEVTIKYKQR